MTEAKKEVLRKVKIKDLKNAVREKYLTRELEQCDQENETKMMFENSCWSDELEKQARIRRQFDFLLRVLRQSIEF